MTRGRGRDRGRKCPVSKSHFVVFTYMPIIPIPAASNTQQGGTSSIDGLNHINQVQTLGPSSSPPIQILRHNSSPTIGESSPTTPNKSNPIEEGISTRANTTGEVESNDRLQQTTHVTLTPKGLEPSRECSVFI